MPEITRILNVNEKIRLTKDVAGAPRFKAGTMVTIKEVRFADMTPPRGMAKDNYLSAMYKIAIYEDYQTRENVTTIKNGKIPHASLSSQWRGIPSTDFYETDQELFLILPFTYKYQGGNVIVPPGTPVKARSPGAVTEKGSKARRLETAVYEVTQQKMVTKQRMAAVADLPVQKIYFE